ncbi:18548_t:CDS:2, partial [Acaulospora morrowiae]
DSELVPLQRDFGKVRTEVEGFFVWQGPLTFERLVDEDEQPKKKAPAKRKPKPVDNETPKVRKKRTVKKADANGNDANAKPTTSPKKRVSKKASVKSEVKNESSSVNGSNPTHGNTKNTFHGDSTTTKDHQSLPNVILNVGASSNPHTPENQKTSLDSNKTLGKRKKTYPTESVHSEVQHLLDVFKELIEA